MDVSAIIARLRALPGPWTRHFGEHRRHVFTPAGERIRDQDYLTIMQALGPVPVPAGGVALEFKGGW